MDDEDAFERASEQHVQNAYREASEHYLDFMKRWAMAVKSFKGKPGLALDCGLLALGFTDILGCQTQVQLARRWTCTKENVRKLVNHIQKLTGAPPTPGQRSEEGRKNMSEKRKGQLRK